MNILAISGSPRRGGNTEVLIDKVLEGASSIGAATGKIILNDLDFNACQECENTKGNGECIVDDDMQKVFQEVERSDVVIVGSPIFFGSISAQTKMMIDRYQCYWMAGIKGDQKKGAFISVSAKNRYDFFQNAKKIVCNFFATINADYKHELLLSGVENKGDVKALDGALQRAFDIGKDLAKEKQDIG